MQSLIGQLETATSLQERYDVAEKWLFNAALPFWGGVGLDLQNGGFHEKFEHNGVAVTGIPRRTRVIARQIYSFAAAGRMGWTGNWRAVVNHGAATLFDRCIRDDGLVISTQTAEGAAIDVDFDFYDHAFALFALAELAQLEPYADRAATVALDMLRAMESRFLHPSQGFLENDWGGLPLRSNPHMHFLEACLTHADLPGASPVWRNWADRVVELAIDKFIDANKGCLREFFDYDWNPMPGESGRIVEPGHQYEWSWLLRWWNQRAANPLIERAAKRLCEIGETYGINPNGIAIDELWDDFTPRSVTSRTWPQTERLKACLAAAQLSEGTDERAAWEHQAHKALGAFAPFFATPILGLWHDRLNGDSNPLAAPAPASTLYHIVCSLETCKTYLSPDNEHD